jgi:hypothetical protein
MSKMIILLRKRAQIRLSLKKGFAYPQQILLNSSRAFCHALLQMGGLLPRDYGSCLERKIQSRLHSLEQRL